MCPGGWADRLVEACDTRYTSRHPGIYPIGSEVRPGGWADRLVEACDTRYASRYPGIYPIGSEVPRAVGQIEMP